MNNKYELTKVTNEEMEGVSFIRLISRGTFLRHTHKQQLGDLEEQLGFSQHHALGKTIASASNASYHKAIINNRLAYVLKLDEEHFFFMKTKNTANSPSKFGIRFFDEHEFFVHVFEIDCENETTITGEVYSSLDEAISKARALCAQECYKYKTFKSKNNPALNEKIKINTMTSTSAIESIKEKINSLPLHQLAHLFFELTAHPPKSKEKTKKFLIESILRFLNHGSNETIQAFYFLVFGTGITLKT